MDHARWFLGIVFYFLATGCSGSTQRDAVDESRVIPLNELNAHIEDPRLPRHVAPTGYRLEIQAFPAEGHFMGRVKINITCREPTDVVFLHAHPELNIRPTGRITVTRIVFQKANSAFTERYSTSVKVLAIKRDPAKQWLMIRLAEKLKKARFYRMELLFDGLLNSNSSEAFFRSSYQDHRTKERRWFVATEMKPTNARRVFPCFDEPAYKVPFEISIARPLIMHAISNMPIRATEIIEEEWVWDHFMRTPPIATFSVGMLISHLDNLPAFNVSSSNGNVSVRVFGREHLLGKLDGVAAIARDALETLQDMFGLAFPLPQLSIAALPHFTHRAPADQWGLMIFQERVLTGKSSSWFLFNSIVTQWLGHLVTPHWWSDARLNQAIANYLATDHVMQTDRHEIWSSLVGYSVYTEFSQHKELAKQSDAAKTTKTEWLLRMLSKSLSRTTFQAGLQEFMRERQYDTYFEDDVWAALTKQAWEDKTLEDPIRVEDIARSWIYQDRFPVVTVNRDYSDNTANVKQHTFLRGRLPKTPINDPLLWWIPIAFLTPDDLELEMEPNTRVTWIKAEKEVTLLNLPEPDKFIIINPEETGMFLVNYDTRHWALLSQYMVLTANDDAAILPTQVRAKLLHDSWSLAFGAELSFATALNMTLFMEKEVSLAVWEVMLSMMQQLLTQIDGTLADGKLKEYMSMLLGSMYEGLPVTESDEDKNVSLLREKAKMWLCDLAYGPCIDEATAAFSQWVQSAATDSTMISERYLCTIIKWNYSQDLEDGLKSVISSRSAQEQLFLLTHFSRCLRNPTAIDSLLNDTLLSVDTEVTPEEKQVVLDQLGSNALGANAMFQFVRGNWGQLATRYANDSATWNFLIEKSVGSFKTNQGFNKAKELYEERKGEFGTAFEIIKEQLKLIKETALWNNAVLPDINSWMDERMSRTMMQ